MACALTQDVNLACKDSVGGIKTLYITELANKNAITASSGNITAFTLTTGNQFWEYQVEKEDAMLEQTTEHSVENGTVFSTQTLTFTMKKMDATKRNELRLLVQNRVMVIILDRNGNYWLLGEDNGMDLTTIAGVTGQAMGDMNGYTLTLLGKEEEEAQTVDSSLIATLTAPAA